MKSKKNMVKFQTEEQREMVHFFVVLFVVVGVVVAVYFISRIFVMDERLFEIDYQTGVINSERAIVGTILNRPEKKYYVMVYDESKPKAIYYSSLSSKYTTEVENALPIYHVDLSNSLNQSYYIGEDGVSNPKATKVSDLKFKDFTLILIENGKISKYLETEEEVVKELHIS